MREDEQETKKVVVDERVLDLLLGGAPPKPPVAPAGKRPAEGPSNHRPPEEVSRRSGETSEPPPPRPVAPKPVARSAPQARRPVQHPDVGRTLKPPLDDWVPRFNEGLRQERLGQYREAAAEFRTACVQHPRDPRVYLASAACAIRLGEPEYALQVLDEANQLQPDGPDVLLLRSLAHHMLGSLKEARDGYLTVLQAMPDSTELLANLTLACIEFGEVTEAAAWAKRLRGLEPETVAGHTALAMAALAGEDYATAAESWAWLAAADAGSYEYAFNLGACCQRLGRLERAYQAYRQALAIRPDAVEAHVNLGTVLHEMGDLSGAEDSYLKALQISPRHQGILRNLAVVSGALGKKDAADRYSRLARNGRPPISRVAETPGG